MTNKSAAARYARALFEVITKEKGNPDEVAAQLTEAAGLLAAGPVGKVLLNPAVPAPRKRAAVAEISKRLTVAVPVGKLLTLLAERDRLALLPDLVDAYQQRLLDHHNVVRAEVTTSVPLDAGRLQQIERGLATATGRKVTLSTRVDPEILGGVVTRIGGTVYDASVSGQLARMKARLQER